jgi:hypothetical protein
MRKKDPLRELKCKLCKTYYLYDFKRGADFRCDKCRKIGDDSFKQVQKELDEMSDQEYQLFLDDIEEYQKECLEKRIQQLRKNR